MDINVENFLKRFHPKDQTVDYVFTSGCCYWFALILNTRFPDSKIMYEPVLNHFVTEIDGRLYDVTGDVTSKYTNIVEWDTYALDDDLYRNRIIRDCINF